MKKYNQFTAWLPMAVVISFLSFMIFGVAQQTIRLGGYNPQIQMAEDAAVDLENGRGNARSVIPNTTIDMATSLAPYMIVYDDKGNVLSSSVELDGKVPSIPQGVLDAVRDGREGRLTWQPKDGVRSAIVIARYVGDKPGFVLAGRSLREIEALNGKILFDVFVGWVATLSVSFMAYFIVRPL